MSFLAPKPPKRIKTPTLEDPQVQDSRRRQRVAAAQARGMDDTLLTGGAGVTGVAPAAIKTLLGQ